MRGFFGGLDASPAAAEFVVSDAAVVDRKRCDGIRRETNGDEEEKRCTATLVFAAYLGTNADDLRMTLVLLIRSTVMMAANVFGNGATTADSEVFIF